MELYERLRAIEEVTRAMDALEEDRDTLTEPLEKAAHAYHAVHPQGGSYYGRGALSCSRCRFVYGAIQPEQDTVVLSTDCSWCGKDSGAGLRVPVSELAKYLEED